MARVAMRRLLETRLGIAGRALLAWRTRHHAESLLARRGLVAAAQELALRLDDRIQRGPFAGLRYPRRYGDIVHAAKLLGAYERELHPALERLLARAPVRVINIGSGDGYYAVGIAARLPEAEAWAVDPDPLAQRACRATARLNAIESRVRSLDRLDARELADFLLPQVRTPIGRLPPRGHALCVVDCEGCEDDLLDPVRAPALAKTDLLVETHDFACAGVTERLVARFAATHDVERVMIGPRDPAAFPELASLPVPEAAGLLDEFRHLPQSWLVLVARDRRP